MLDVYKMVINKHKYPFLLNDNNRIIWKNVNDKFNNQLFPIHIYP